jgi:hypothetical protein
MAQQTGWDFGWEMTVEQVCEFAALVAAAEREACAKVCEDIDNEYEGEDVLAAWCADAIRARIKARTRAPRSRRREKRTP